MHKEYSTDEAGGRVRQRKSMLSKQDVKRMIADVLRTEAARCRLDVLAVLEPGQEEDLFTRMPREVLETAMQKAADLFGYEKRDFSSLDLMLRVLPYIVTSTVLLSISLTCSQLF